MGESMDFCELIINQGLFDYAYQTCVKRMLKDGLGTKVEGKKFPQMPSEEFQDRMASLLHYAEGRFQMPTARDTVREHLKDAIDTLLEEQIHARIVS